jgi:hypothetical protein
MRVYHFTNAEFGLQDIRRRRLKIARISELNDPFEFLQVASQSAKTRGRYEYVKRGLNEYMGLVCFSETRRNPVQWSHYADRHRGICLGFDVAASAGMRKVRYVERRIAPNIPAMQSESPAATAHMLDLLTLKFKHWEYEQEHRLFVQLEEQDADTGHYFFDFGEAGPVKLREVIVGVSSAVSPEQIADALGDLQPKVKSCKARLASQAFEVVKPRNRDLWRPTRPRIALRQPTLEAAIERALRAEDFSKVRAAAADQVSATATTRRKANKMRRGRTLATPKPGI